MQSWTEESAFIWNNDNMWPLGYPNQSGDSKKSKHEELQVLYWYQLCPGLTNLDSQNRAVIRFPVFPPLSKAVLFHQVQSLDLQQQIKEIEHPPPSQGLFKNSDKPICPHHLN